MPEAKTADNLPDDSRDVSNEHELQEQASPGGDAPASDMRSPGWEAYLNDTGDEATPGNPPGTGFYRTGIMAAVTGLLFPLFFCPIAVVLGLAARDERHPRALIPIVLGLLITLYGATYYFLATRGPLR